ncbi:S-4TM family putative pore-forming effector [Bradyrhizobium quebecense]|uniref:SMODS and SLOG-associating 2TM effector domain-containing protein n=2 Tax=Bradyrhizobium quebecense TaxID=2748629 RepID=A0ABS3MT52_9BRAD|nr:S-4TM family putative pore-forming effector [Bradyrhizobium quebecense]UGY02472.1 S-4TM family putative pore-forming effector [Bradyrhizobium quebecense]
MNTIARDQDTPEFQRLLMARQRIYSDATRYQILQIALTVALPVVGAVLALAYPQARPYVALYGLIATALDVMWVDRMQRRLLKVAAKISEEFDCTLLKMPWNSFVAGKRGDAETIDAAARRWSDDASSIAGWYIGITATARHPMARLVCQRMNLQYDASLRRKYGTYLISGAGILFITLIIAAVANDLKLIDSAAIAATISPAIFWAIREHFRQSDSAATNEILKGEAEKFLDSVRANGCDDAECDKRSRELQDALFQRRVANPLVLPAVYRLMRNELEKQAHAGADALLK